MSLYLTNGLTGKKELFEPLTKGKVRMYVCGITPYDSAHLGHARCAVVFDVLRRTLSHLGLEVLHIQNITDVDDKIINRAREEAVSPSEIAEKYTREYENLCRALNVLPPSSNPKATEHIPEMLQLIEKLISRGLAYAAGGDVYFQVSRFSAYGKLSKRKTDEMLAGARVLPGENKKEPLDFALWKAAKPGEPSWDSPWGKGRPGWHIECSAMCVKYLGETLDIHGGGQDLVFPHHENEIAQSEGATQRPFARFWIHNGLVTMKQEKMSKSLKNFFKLDTAINDFGPLGVRLFLLSRHCRAPLDFTGERLVGSRKEAEDLSGAVRSALFVLKRMEPADSLKESDAFQKYEENFWQALSDDLNTEKAISILHEISGALKRSVERRDAGSSDLALLSSGVKTLLRLARDGLGLVLAAADSIEENVRKRIDEREKARAGKQFSKADEIRRELEKEGVLLEDTPHGTRWRRRS